MKTAAVVLALLASCSWGEAQQSAGPPQMKPENLAPNVRLYEPKNLTPQRAQRVAEFVQSVVNIRVYWDDTPRAIIVRGGSEKDQDAAEALLKRFDVADSPRITSPVDLTVYLIRAWSGSAPGTYQSPAKPVPAELDSAVEEMKHTFNYDHYALWDAIVVQPKGGGEIQGILPNEPGGRPYVYNLSYAGLLPTTDKGTLNLFGFEFSIKMPAGKDDIESHIKTDVTVKEGQKLVLGKIRLLNTTYGDLFLVLATKVH